MGEIKSRGDTPQKNWQGSLSLCQGKGFEGESEVKGDEVR